MRKAIEEQLTKNREDEESKNWTTSEEGRQKVTFIKRRVSGIADPWRGLS